MGERSISWSAFHASSATTPVDPPVINSLLPLFYEKASTISMIKHGMEIERQITEYLNPGQIPVTTFDQPLFALAKLVQWCWPVPMVRKSMLSCLEAFILRWLFGVLLEISWNSQYWNC